MAIRRAARLADGFKFVAPTGLDPDRVAGVVADLRAEVANAGRDPAAFGIEVRIVLQATTEADWPDLFARAHALGASHLGLANRIAGGSVDDQIAACERFAAATRALW